jgi:hypothetical protein
MAYLITARFSIAFLARRSRSNYGVRPRAIEAQGRVMRVLLNAVTVMGKENPLEIISLDSE